MTAPVLQISDLAKSVPGGRVLFEGLNLRLAAGEFVAIMGESGVGKSTLLNLIAGLDQADAGVIAIDGVDLAGLDDDARTLLRRDRVGFVFQAFHILPHLTLGQNVALPLALQGQGGARALEHADRMLAAVGLAGRGGDYPRQLSGGEMQRVAIARALIHRPGLLLADEPTGNLDPQTSAAVFDSLYALARQEGVAALVATHNLELAKHMDRVLALKDGHLEAQTL